MFRKVGLHPSKKGFHQFIVRKEDGLLQDWRMNQLTFGVTSSPFLASQVLRRAASDYRNDFPRAARVIDTTFYVDDCLTGAPAVSEALGLRMELNNLLDQAGMMFRKWRSNSSDLLISIP